MLSLLQDSNGDYILIIATPCFPGDDKCFFTKVNCGKFRPDISSEVRTMASTQEIFDFIKKGFGD